LQNRYCFFSYAGLGNIFGEIPAQYFEQALAASKNSKKSWEILKEAASLRKSRLVL
jgi:hypothetical protein